MDSRRLPVYLLLDCSESMAGPAIEAVAQAVETLVNELKNTPQAVQTAYLSVITFSRVARQARPLTELMSFQPPKLSVRPGTGLGEALRLLMECIEREVVTTTQNVKGDYKPLVFLLTDGQPTDQWEEAAAMVKQRCQSGKANVIAVGCGPDVDFRVLSSVTEMTLAMPKLLPDTIRKSFIWISASIKTMSSSLGRDGGGNPLELTPPPPGTIELVGPQTSFGDGQLAPRQVFVPALCSRSRNAQLSFVVRYVRRKYEDAYSPVAAHQLEHQDGEDEGAWQQQRIMSSLLLGWADCPYCGNAYGSRCPVCRTMICRPKSFDYIFCPKCQTPLKPAHSSNDFDIDLTPG